VHPYLYDAGTTIDLGTLGGAAAYPLAHNSAGDVIGYSARADGVMDGFLYRDGVMGQMEIGFTEPAGINEAGVVVGRDLYGPVVWDAVNGLQSLHYLTGSDTPYTIEIAADINDVGQIVARGTRVSDESMVVLILTPAED
jgi:probable HAF family extracellular repeat protein